MALSTDRIKSTLPKAAGKQKPKCFTLKKIYIEQIRAGTKRIEGRIADKRIRKLEVGDLLRFYYYTNAKDDVLCKVLGVNYYATFRKMLEAEGVARVLPKAAGLESAVKAYAAIPKYPEKEKKFGVAAIEVEAIEK